MQDFYQISFDIVVNNEENARKMTLIIGILYYMGLISLRDYITLQAQINDFRAYAEDLSSAFSTL